MEAPKILSMFRITISSIISLNTLFFYEKNNCNMIEGFLDEGRTKSVKILQEDDKTWAEWDVHRIGEHRLHHAYKKVKKNGV